MLRASSLETTVFPPAPLHSDGRVRGTLRRATQICPPYRPAAALLVLDTFLLPEESFMLLNTTSKFFYFDKSSLPPFFVRTRGFSLPLFDRFCFALCSWRE
uniref:Uncharacterized protein n=1 Tax=Cacopsylla melanoneura TaxID=428564 RepID=A0A8D8QKJ7_9HEMI